MQNFTIEQIADEVQAKIINDLNNSNTSITGLASITAAQKGQLTFIIGGKYKQNLMSTQASAVLLTEEFAKYCPTTALVVNNPELCFAKIAELYAPKKRIKPNIHPSAVLGEQTNIDSTVSIGANCVLGDNVCIGANTVIHPGVILGDNVAIGENCCIYPRVTFYSNVTIGDRVTIHSGAVIGADGFGYTNDNGRWHKIPQLCGVIIGDDVEIGANTTIDRGALENTVVASGVKIDNQVQVAHNVKIGEHSIIAGCTAIAGSTTIGKHCMLGGSCDIGDHVTLVDHVILTGNASVPRSIKKPGVYSSFLEVQPRMDWVKTLIRLHQLDNIVSRLKSVEKKQNESD